MLLIVKNRYENELDCATPIDNVNTLLPPSGDLPLGDNNSIYRLFEVPLTEEEETNFLSASFFRYTRAF